MIYFLTLLFWGNNQLIFMTIFLIKLGADYIFLVYSSISKITKIRYQKENNQKIKKDNATKNITNLNIQINNLKANQEKGSKISLTQENDNTKKSMNKNTEAKSDKKEKNLSKKNQKINKNEKRKIMKK